MKSLIPASYSSTDYAGWKMSSFRRSPVTVELTFIKFISKFGKTCLREFTLMDKGVRVPINAYKKEGIHTKKVKILQM